MQRIRSHHAVALAADAHEGGDPTTSPFASGRMPVAAVVGSDGRHDTPLLPSHAERAGRPWATLTVTTGLDAGRPYLIPRTGLTIGHDPGVDIVADDDGVSAKHAHIGVTSTGAYRIEDLGSTNGTFVGTSRVKRAVLSAGDCVQLGPAFRMRFALSDAGDVALHQGVYESSVRDPLTRAFNRGYLLDRLFVEILHARRARTAIAILLFDLDHFKALNDGYGHLAGDRALLAVADEVRRAMRREDVFGRYGGEEFLILTRETTHSEASRLAERVRRAIAGLCFCARSKRLSVTTSVGVASLSELTSDAASSEALIALADKRLYAAKRAGRDRVCARIEPTR